jgi:hypothetical protein
MSVGPPYARIRNAKAPHVLAEFYFEIFSFKDLSIRRRNDGFDQAAAETLVKRDDLE